MNLKGFQDGGFLLHEQVVARIAFLRRIDDAIDGRLSQNGGTKHSAYGFKVHGFDFGTHVYDFGVAPSKPAFAHVTLGAGHEASQFHFVVGFAHFHHHLEKFQSLIAFFQFNLH